MRKHLALRLILLLTFLMTIGSSIFRMSAVLAQFEEQYTYYGYIPWNIFGYYEEVETFGRGPLIIQNESVRTNALVIVIGNYDNTRVRVYKLPEKNLIEEFAVDKLQYYYTHLPNGTFFKVLSNKPATVILMGGAALDSWPGPPHPLWPNRARISTFYTSTNGGYVGKEFIFLAMHERTPGRILPFRVYALEDSDITIWNVNGTQVSSFRLSANQVRDITFTYFEIYRLVSTGNIIVESGPPGTVFYPSVQGGFLGTLFYGPSYKEGESQWYPESNVTFKLTSLEGTKFFAVDLKYMKKIAEGSVATVLSLNRSKGLMGEAIAVQSEHPIMLYFGDPVEGSGVCYTGLRSGQVASIYIPQGESYLFAYEESTIVTVDDTKYELSADGILPLPSGLHKIGANKNVVVQIVNYAKPPYRTSYLKRLTGPPGFTAFGAVVPSVQALNLDYSDLKLKPLLAEEPILRWIIVPIIVMVTTLVLWLVKRQKGRGIKNYRG